MIAKRFNTTAIFFKTLAELEAFVERLSGIRVDAFDFSEFEAPESDQEEQIFLGTPLKLDIDREKLSVIVNGVGGLKYYDLNKLPENFEGVPETYDLLEDFFNFDFYSGHQDVAIHLVVHRGKHDTTEKLIKLSEYHSKEAYEQRLVAKQASIMEVKQMIKKMNQKLETLKTQNRTIQLTLHKLEQEAPLDQAS